MSMSKEEFNSKYFRSPKEKVMMAEIRIEQFYNHFGGKVFLSFSGGKDSQVLGDIIRNMKSPYNDIEFVFFDTHNENKSVYEVVERYGATVVSSPLLPQQVIEKVGYPLFNKEIAHTIDGLQRNLAWTREGGISLRAKERLEKVKERYSLFINSPLHISDGCCNELKKKPSIKFQRETGKYPILATLAVESFLRMQAYLRRGACNSFEGKIQSTPIAFWSKQDILWYIAQKNLKIADCYGAKITTHGLLNSKTCELCGVEQTGCMFCGFGKGIDYAKRVLKSKCPEYVKEHQEEFDSLQEDRK